MSLFAMNITLTKRFLLILFLQQLPLQANHRALEPLDFILASRQFFIHAACFLAEVIRDFLTLWKDGNDNNTLQRTELVDGRGNAER
jgi:hypothetical protein